MVLILFFIHDRQICKNKNKNKNSQESFQEYWNDIDHSSDDFKTNRKNGENFEKYFDTLDEDTYIWHDHWKTFENDPDLVDYCNVIELIYDDVDSSCLCELKVVCDDICDYKLQNIFENITTYYITPWSSHVNSSRCQEVLTKLQHKKYDTLCSDTTDYQLIYQCGIYYMMCLQYISL